MYVVQKVHGVFLVHAMHTRTSRSQEGDSYVCIECKSSLRFYQYPVYNAVDLLKIEFDGFDASPLG